MLLLVMLWLRVALLSEREPASAMVMPRAASDEVAVDEVEEVPVWGV